MAMARTFPGGLDYWETLVYPSLDSITETIVDKTKRLKHISVYVKSFVTEMKWSTRYLSCKYGFKDGVLFALWLILRVPKAMVNVLIFQLLRMLYFLCSMLYSQMWKVAARLDFPPIKYIEQKKKEYEEANKVLEYVCQTIKKQDHIKSSDLYTRPILEAACQDAYEVVDEILRQWPEAIRCTDKNSYDIIQLATIHRSENIYNLIYIIEERKSIYGTIEDSSTNNMLHLAGRLAPSNKLKRRTGAALQLQRELQWRQEVEGLVFPAYVTKENIFKETPEMVFTKEHEELVKEGEKWIKTVAESCSITAALITTIVFAAAITVPGGSTQETGVPVFMNDIAFNIFAIADAISLFSSATALLVFVSILTSRFAEEDFLVRLPRRLIIGLCTLLLSTTAMMVAFSATLFIVFSHHKVWMLGSICGLSSLPIAIFFIIQ
ncbi:uncharacterized protein LOC143604026, partial [Bidens hawaiensis]|uniref:uncharacterized protein LOC143604026 n=1 Tax=Bidens hawaiensis TaxID=980011 RepID=UPI0040492B7E